MSLPPCNPWFSLIHLKRHDPFYGTVYLCHSTRIIIGCFHINHDGDAWELCTIFHGYMQVEVQTLTHNYKDIWFCKISYPNFLRYRSWWFNDTNNNKKVTKFQFSEATERPGYFVGLVNNLGDVLMFKILKNETVTVLHISVVRSAADTSHRNKRVSFTSDV
jgi:hypothetical protein